MAACGIKYRGSMRSHGDAHCVEPAGHAGPREGATPHSDGCGMMWWEEEDFSHLPHMVEMFKPKPKRAPRVTVEQARADARKQAFAEVAAEAERRADASPATMLGSTYRMANQELAAWARGRT